MDDEYWSAKCVGCNTGHTNLECVTQVAANVGMTVEEAKKVFIPEERTPYLPGHTQRGHPPVASAWTNWTAKAKPEDITNG
jgi:hypothetical protein